MLVLDNDVLRKYRTADPDPSVVEYLADNSSQAWAIPTIVLYEYLNYYDRSRERARQRRDLHQFVDEIVPLDEEVVVEATDIADDLSAVGTSLATPDLFAPRPHVTARRRLRPPINVTSTGSRSTTSSTSISSTSPRAPPAARPRPREC